MNQVMLTGRLTKNPIINIHQSIIKVANFTLAVNEKTSDMVDYIDIVAWNNLAVSVEKYLQKGSKINVIGKIKNEKYETKKGKVKYKFYVLAREIDYLLNTKEEPKKEKFFKKIT